jgi:hypothetical protein
MAKVIEARAVISAADHTGAVFDKIAAKMKGVEKVAKSFEGIKAPAAFVGKFNDELSRLKLSEKELQSVRKSFGDLDRTLKSSPIGAANYFRAIKDWEGKTVNHWRAVKASVDDAHESHKKFFKTAGHYAMHAAGIGGGAYLAGHAIKEVIKGAAARNREGIRYEQMGLTGDQLSEGNNIADTISAKFPSISRTEVLEDLRKNASRLGSFDRAKEIAEVYARAKISNKLSGGDDHELEQVVRAAEGAGAANSPGQFSSFINAFSRAKAANPDYTGEEFAKDYRAAGAAKYGWDKDFRENVFPVLASHTSGFGVKMATANSALVGGRMTKQSKASLQEAGLLDKNGHLVDEAGFQSNMYEWAQAHFKPLMEAKGVKFNEDMSEEDKRTVAGSATKMFSAKNAADAIITAVLDAPLVEKARHRKTMDLEGMDDLQKKDVGLAFEALTTQAKDAAIALVGLKPVINQLSQESQRLANVAKFLRTGEFPNKPNPLAETLGLPDHPAMTPSQMSEYNNAQGMVAELNNRLIGTDGDQSPGIKKARLKLFEAQQKVWATQNMDSMPPITDDNIMRIRDRPVIPLPRSYPRKGSPFPHGVPVPMSDPRKGPSDMPAVQPLDSAPQRVDVQIAAEPANQETTIKLEAGPWFQNVEAKINSLIKIVGSLGANAPGSTGKSSPDAGATGGSSGSW